MEDLPPMKPSATRQRKFSVTAFPTIDPALEDRWERGIGIQSPTFTRAEIVFHQQPVHILILFAGYGVDAHMHAQVDFSWKLRNAHGKQVMGAKDLEGIKGRVLNGDFILRPRIPIQLTFPFESEVGSYLLEVQAHCRVSKRKAKSEISLQLSPFRLLRQFESVDAVEAWMQGYAMAPSPQRMPDAYLLCWEKLGKDHPDSFFNALAFCGEVLRMNGWLAQALEARWDQMGQGAQAAFTMLFHAARYPSAIPSVAAVLLDRMKAPFPSAAELMSRPVSHPQELDLIWALHRANGSYASFRKACTAVAPMPEAMQAVVHEETQGVLAKAAAWSIERNISLQENAMMYAMALFREHDLHPRVYMYLERLLQARGWVRNGEMNS